MKIPDDEWGYKSIYTNVDIPLKIRTEVLDTPARYDDQTWIGFINDDKEVEKKALDNFMIVIIVIGSLIALCIIILIFFKYLKAHHLIKMEGKIKKIENVLKSKTDISKIELRKKQLEFKSSIQEIITKHKLKQIDRESDIKFLKEIKKLEIIERELEVANIPRNILLKRVMESINIIFDIKQKLEKS